ncbi:hypothetical protein [Emcibacter nanhaiensis]|uniref:Uncharacterized protein n=1 Tax=Emcibacter nanhaiensis TaxID=1505037 RepID=A0A501PRJ0_9PROT|nr:hypothetical protein FIV46_01490 [Emcibacter nanhaiensis]
MAISPSGEKLCVANGRSGSISVVNTQIFKVIKENKVGIRPWGVVIQ